MKKRIISLALSMLLLLSLMPAQTLAEMIIIPFPDEDNTGIIKPWYPNADAGGGYNSSVSGEDILNAMMAQTAPDSFSDDTLTPYATQKGEAFTILEKAEIFEYISNAGVTKVSAFHDDLKENNYAVTGSMTDMTGTDDAGSIPEGLRFARGVAFDPTGSGRRDHVAIIGFRDEGNNSNKKRIASFHLYIINAETKKTVEHLTIAGASERFGTLIANLNLVDSGNLIQITAGDYNGNGRDSLVIYNGSSLYEVSCATSGYSSNCINDTTNGALYLHSEYQKSSSLKSDDKVQNQLCTSLASGDVNGDGIDDLVVLSYTGAISDSSVGNATCIPQLSVGYGKRSASGVSALSIDRASVGTKQSNGTTTNTIACPGVAVGDIDGDGKNEIIAAGYFNKSTSSKPLSVDDSQSANPVAYTYYKTSGAGKLQRVGNIRELKRAETSPIAKDDSLREKEYLYQQLSVECVALEGMHTQEYVFLSGWFYCLDDTGNLQSIASNTVTEYEKDDFSNLFDELQPNVDGVDVDEIFIHSASVGNVFGTKDGKEAILLVVGYKTHTDDNKEGKYHFKECVYYHRGRTSADDMKTETIWFSIFMDKMRPTQKLTGKPDAEMKEFSNGSSGSPNVLLLAVDFGTDSVVGKYSGKAYSYTDPTPVAFLQAAPYFSELGAGNSSTQYSYSEGYRITSGTSEEVSYNVGFATEVEAGPIQSSMEVGLAYELNQEFTSSIDKTYTATFEANDQNQVILRQTLMYYYFYDVQVFNPTTGKYEFLKNEMIISAPQYPVLTSVSMEQYNELATAYNKKVDESTDSKVKKEHKMELITDALKTKYFLNNEGNPFAYASSAAAYTYNGIPGWDLSQAKVGDTDTWMMLSYAGGTQSQTYSVTLEEEKTKSVAEGCYSNMSLMVGGGSDILNVSAYAGITAEYERLKGSSISKASMTSTETSGTVQNLSSDLTNYGFNWKLIGWKTDDLFEGVPFLGYAVKNQKDLPKPVDDLKAEYSAENLTVTLTFTAPETDPGRMAATHFYAYDDLHDGYVGACSYSSSNPNRTITVDVTGYLAAGATFTVIPYNESNNLRGMPSNEAYCLFVMSSTVVSALIQEVRDKVAALETAIKNQDSDYASKLDELIKAYQAADEALKSQVDEDLEAAQEALKKAMEEADDALQKAIDKVNTDLSASIEKLSQDTDEALEQAITDLTNAYTSADTILKADIESLSGKLTNLEKTLKDADGALQKAIDKVNTDLTKAIDDLSKATDENLAEAVGNLTTAYTNADALLKTEMNGNLTDLEGKMNDADDALQKAIDKVNTDLTKAIDDLSKATAENLAEAVGNLTTAYTNADALLKAGIDSLSEELAALEQAMIEADDALLAAIEQVKADLDAAKKELETALAEEKEALNNKIDTLNSALEAAYKLADEMLIKNMNDLSQRLDELNAQHQQDIDALRAELEAKHQEDIDALRVELDALKAQIAKQDEINSNAIQTLNNVDGTQQEAASTNRTIAIVGLCIGSVSLLGNGALLLSLLKKKSSTKV